MAKLAPHQAAWLAAHPYRTEAWLRAMLADGFEVHHADGDHANDDARNLVLIETMDHANLHGWNERRLAKARLQAETASTERLALGKKIYECKVDGISWKSAGIKAGMSLDRWSSPSTVKRLCDAYAIAAGLPLHVHRPTKRAFHRMEPWA